MKVFIPTPLRSYTNEKSVVTANGKTVSELLEDLNHEFPGIRFRIVNEQDQIREHIKIFIGSELASNLSERTNQEDIHIICSLSGG